MLTRRLALLPLALGLVLLAGACGGDSGAEAVEGDGRLGTVVARHVEGSGGAIAGTQADELAIDCTAVAACTAHVTVAFGDGAVRDLLVSGTCYVAVAIGDPWPHPAPECR